MSALHDRWRRLCVGLVPVLGLLLTLSVLAVAAHHHDEDAARHDHCAVCTTGQALAVTTDDAPATLAPPRPTKHVAPPALLPLPEAFPGAARGRAPPTV